MRTYGLSMVHTYGCSTDTGVEFTDMGILHFCYRRTNLHARTYIRA